jgi:dienelactone hydrolase
MAAALPLADVQAWRVYLDLPMHGSRQLSGGLDEFMRLGYEDAVLKAFEPQVSQAVDEFPAVLAALRERLPVTEGAIGLVGASIGALPAELVIACGMAPVSAAALVSPVIQLAEVVAANERRFAVTYPWSEDSRSVADSYDFIARADQFAEQRPQPAVLLINGADDDPAFARQTDRLQRALRERYDDPKRVAIAAIPGMGHAFADEPGTEPASQTHEAELVNDAITEWFIRHLR